MVNNEVELVISYILDFENEDNPFDIRKSAIEDFFKYAVQNIIESPELLGIAKEVKKTGLKSKDSLHIASAIVAKCNYFITTDIRLLKYKDQRIKILNPIEFIIEMEECNNE